MDALHNISLEQQVLVAVMSDNSAFDYVSDLLTKDDFFAVQHRIIWAAIHGFLSRNEPADMTIVANQLAKIGELDHAGGMGYFVEMARTTSTSSANTRAYAQEIRGFSIRRRLLAASDNIREAVEGRLSTPELLAEAERQVLSVSDAGGLSGAITAYSTTDLIASALHTLESAQERKPGELSGLPSGVQKLDEATDGFQPGDMIVIGARPSMGKTTIMMNLIEAALSGAGQDDGCAVIFSIEQPKKQIVDRLLAQLSGVDYSRILRGPTDEDWPRITAAMNRLRDMRIELCDSGRVSPTEMAAFCRRMKRKHGRIRVIGTDYIQKIHIPSYQANQRVLELTEISQALKNLAKDCECPHFVLSQLSRSVDSRPNKRPMLSDLRESGAIEQDADLVIMPYRDEVYNPETTDKGIVELIIRKNRNGTIGTAFAVFDGPRFRIRDAGRGFAGE